MVKNLLIFTFVLIADQLSKRVVYISGAYYELNTGFALSILNDFPNIVIFINLLFVVILLVSLLRLELKSIEKNILSAVLGAGISNLSDRIVYGGVIDFIKIEQFSTLNLADLIITLGISILIIIQLKDEAERIYSKRRSKREET